MILFSVFALVLGIFILIKATKFSVELVRVIGLKIKVPVFLMSSIFLAMATSFPEFFVGILSAVNRESILSLGNILGANIANITLILGLSALFSGGVNTGEKILRRDVLITALLSFLPLLLLLDGRLSFKDGLILLLAYVIYNIFLYENEKSQLSATSVNNRKNRILFFELFTWLLVLAGSAHVVVKASEQIAAAAHFPIIFVGLFLVALGTSLPEMIVSIKAAEEKETGIFFGNVLGSVAINSTLVLGIAVMISPINGVSRSSLTIPGAALLLAFLLLPLFLRSNKRLERKEGLVLVGLYLGFLLTEFFLGLH